MNRTLRKEACEKNILVTGGAGFIGSHTCVELLEAGYNVVIADDLSNANEVAIDRIKKIEGLDGESARIKFYQKDVCNKKAMSDIFDDNEIDAVIHFAAFKAVGESCEKPLEYYQNNLGGAITVLQVAKNHDCKNFIFSSSATVYGEPDSVPLFETSPKKNPTNPYGWTKSMNEQILTDIAKSDPEWNIVLLRYFNPI